MKEISVAIASKNLLNVILEIRAGRNIVLTLGGVPVATMSPVLSGETGSVRHEEAWRDLLDHLRTRPALNLGKFNRDELYDDD